MVGLRDGTVTHLRYSDTAELIQIGCSQPTKRSPAEGTKVTTFVHYDAHGAMRRACRDAHRFRPEQDVLDEGATAEEGRGLCSARGDA